MDGIKTRGGKMEKNINITVNTISRKVCTDTKLLGIKGENLQGYFVIDFEGKEFIEGAGWLETQIGEIKGYIALTRENNTYKAPIKSAITQATGVVQLQVRITQGTLADDTPIFKSDIFTLTVLDSISAVDEIPDKYPEWIETANAKLGEIDDALAELTEAEKGFVPVELSSFRAISAPSKSFRETSSIYINNGSNGFRMTLKDVKSLNTKILDVDKIENADFDKLDVGDYIYSKQ